MMLHLGFELVSHQLDCITNDSWLRCHVFFKVSYHTCLGNIVLSFSHIQVTFRFKIICIRFSCFLSEIVFGAFCRQKGLAILPLAVRQRQPSWMGWWWVGFPERKHLHPKYPAEKTNNDLRYGSHTRKPGISSRPIWRWLVDFHTPKTKGGLGLGCPKMPLPKKHCFRNL